jgi:tetratricopeptide (TPR) repeat protein
MRYKSVIVALVLLVTAAIADAALLWQSLTSSHFKIISQLSEKDTLAWADEFNLFIEALHNVFPIDERRLTPLTIVLFADDREFKQYKIKQPDGNTSDAMRGYFFSLEAWSIIGLAKMANDEVTRRTIYHEAVHWYMSADPRQYPLWFMEGMAETFSTFIIRYDHVKLGTMINSHLTLLNTERRVPFERLINITRQDDLFNDEKSTGLFYAQSWALVHYLVFGDHDTSHSFMKLYRDALNMDHPDQAILHYFGHDFKKLDRTIEEYVKYGSFHYGKVTIGSARENSHSLNAASPAEIYAAFSRLAFASNQYVLARVNAERVIQFAPDEPAGYELLVLISSAAKDPDEMSAALEKALKCGSKDAWTMILAANAEWEKFKEDVGHSQEEVRQIANLYKKAISFQPYILSAYKNCARVLLNAQSFETDDMKIIKQGSKIFPRQSDIILCEAYVTYSNGNKDAALQLLDSAIVTPGLEFPLEDFAHTLKRNWIFSRYTDQVSGLISEQKFTEALSFIDQCTETTDDMDLKKKLKDLRIFVEKQLLMFSKE